MRCNMSALKWDGSLFLGLLWMLIMLQSILAAINTLEKTFKKGSPITRINFWHFHPNPRSHITSALQNSSACLMQIMTLTGLTRASELISSSALHEVGSICCPTPHPPPPMHLIKLCWIILTLTCSSVAFHAEQRSQFCAQKEEMMC